MSSRIHYDGNHDPILRYAPSRVRAQAQQPRESASAPVERPPPSQAANSIEFSGDRAIVEMRQRLALDPEWVPEPPQDAAPGRDLWTLALYASGVLGVAALLAWVGRFRSRHHTTWQLCRAGGISWNVGFDQFPNVRPAIRRVVVRRVVVRRDKGGSPAA